MDAAAAWTTNPAILGGVCALELCICLLVPRVWDCDSEAEPEPESGIAANMPRPITLTEG